MEDKTSLKPNFFIVGHPRCGTSSLYNMLKQHPEIFLSEKEPHYFDTDVKQKTFYEEEYLNLFQNVENEEIIGEVTPGYLRSEVAAEKIQEFNPDAKILMILRNPIDLIRAWFQKAVEGGKEDYENIEKNVWSSEYLNLLRYSQQIKRYLRNFPKENIKVIIYGDFKESNLKILEEILGFLNLDPHFIPEMQNMNPSRFNRFGKLNLLLQKPLSLKIRQVVKDSLPKNTKEKSKQMYRNIMYKKGKIEIPEETKNKLKEYLKPEVERTDYMLKNEGFLKSERDLIKEWGFEDVK